MTLTILAAATLFVLQRPEADARGTRDEAVQPAAATAPPRGESNTGQPSKAEQVARLQRSIENDQERLAALREDLDAPDGEYAKAKAEFEALDATDARLRKALREAKEANSPQAGDIEEELADVEKPRALARERFDLAIEERNLALRKIETLEKKISQDRQALDRLTGVLPVQEPETPSTTPPTPQAASTSQAPSSAKAPQAPAPAPTSPAPAAPAPVAEAESPAPAPTATAPAKPASPALAVAQTEAQAKAERAQVAEKDAEAISERLTLLDRLIVEERNNLRTAQRRSDNANQSRGQLAQEYQEKLESGAAPVVLNELTAGIREAEQRFQDARTEVRHSMTRLDELQSERAQLQAEQLAALRSVEAARDDLAAAERALRRLQNPFAFQNILRWAAEHGPKLLAIGLAMLVLHTLSRWVSGRIIRVMSRGAAGTTPEERENRARTLVGVFQNASAIVILVGGILMMFQQVGVPVAPLMGGAAVFGLAVAFGAQNLIRDYFYGFVILLENQFTLNDVVQIGDASGQVEQITLRMTVLRDMHGRVHFIPNGEITRVTNMSYGWSRAVIDVGVAYKEDVDRVITVIKELGAEMRLDPLYGLMILEDLTMLGVEELRESAIMIRFMFKTRPLQQWGVRREMLRRLKRRFDDLGIELPFPQLTVHPRYDGVEPTQGRPSIEGRGLLRAGNGDWSTT